MKGIWEKTAEQISEVYQEIRRQKPLIHMIPNTVSAALCADGLSALGARPLMAVAAEEMAEITEQADISVVNLGQLNQEKLKAAEQVFTCAEEIGRPVVLDPVGCGASQFRLLAVQKLLAMNWKGIVKGNRSELYSIQQNQLTKEGIDTVAKRQLLSKVPAGRVYLATGQVDCLFWEDRNQELLRPYETRGKIRYNIVGTGCLSGAVAGACCSVVNSPKQEEGILLAAAASSFGMAFALEQAGKESGYGSAKAALLDGLCRLSENEFQEWLRIREDRK